ncbi:Hypothetical protein, putative [Bodo saltans]|uniref:Uncharacterized protein n=1 Tax=Bodo saltans TaxID=75058 RepID=A0A0S4IMP1_BODSA|nr:Hypothetical protein, putative [Bodo saltans]|eukprot:CUF50429.1 Hypothetical protein, putative [Bodo saltans]
MFGGWPPSDELEEVAAREANGSPLYMLPLAVLRHLLVSSRHRNDSSERVDEEDTAAAAALRPQASWTKITAGVMPRTRHGHHLVCCEHETYLFGGSYWAHGDTVAPQDMVYDHLAGHWYQTEPLFPSRFCSAVTASGSFRSQPLKPTATPNSTSMVVVYSFGGLDLSRQTTSSLFRAWLPSRSWEEITTFGSVPAPQFKSCLVADVMYEYSPADRREGKRTEGRLFHLDGFLPDTSRVKRLHMLDLSTDIWREVCFAPDLVRSQIAHISYSEERADSDLRHNNDEATASLESTSTSTLSAGRVASFTVFGGMPSRKGKRFRSSAMATFNTRTMMWDQSKLVYARVPGVTAHVVVAIPPTAEDETVHGNSSSSNAKRDDVLSGPLRSMVVSLSICGNEDDPLQPDENSLGRQTSSIHVFSRKPRTLKEIAARHIHQMRIPCHINASPAPRDEILDELF